MAWEPPFEDEFGRDAMDALIEINSKLADIREHVAVIRELLQDDEDGEEAEED
jgi:hypothetical protein